MRLPAEMEVQGWKRAARSVVLAALVAFSPFRLSGPLDSAFAAPLDAPSDALSAAPAGAERARGLGPEASRPAEPAFGRSRFEILVGLAGGLRADSAETHVSIGAAIRARPSARLGWGIEASAEELYDGPNQTSFGAVAITPFAEIRSRGPGGVHPFAAAGAGIYSWRRCAGTAGDDIYACSVIHPDRSRSSFGGWIGAGIRTGISGTRSIAFSARLDLLSTFRGGWPFFRLVVSIGF